MCLFFIQCDVKDPETHFFFLKKNSLGFYEAGDFHDLHFIFRLITIIQNQHI